jgi:formate C-acetyltransferase
VDPLSGERLGPATGEPESFDGYEAFEAALRAQLDAMVRTTTEVINRQYAVMAHSYPDFFKSLLIEGCLERGRDYRWGGPLYTEGLVDVLGLTNVADSLLVIKRLVYEQGRLSLPELVRVLDDDWAGEEALRQTCLHGVPKFGNDDPEADAVCVRLFEYINDAFRARERIHGGHFGVDVVGWTGAVIYGQQTGATPDGRRRGQPLVDSVGAVQGLDRAGVTAALRSVAGLPHDRAHGILALNLRFASRTYAGRDAVDKMARLVEAAFSLGIQQLQINVVDADTLRHAQAHPEQHESLLVRVGGFSTYFNWLSREHQDDIIARTEHEV